MNRKLVTEKNLHFQGKNTDLEQLTQRVTQELQSQGYQTQSTKAPVGYIIQAKKAGILRDIIAADRAFTIMITGQPNDFSVHIGIGRWIQNLAVTAAEAVLLSVLFLAVDVPEMLWTVHVENEIARRITRIVGSEPTRTTTATAAESPATQGSMQSQEPGTSSMSSRPGTA